jgi:hypothetical protein
MRISSLEVYSYLAVLAVIFFIGLYDFIKQPPKEKREYISFYCHYPRWYWILLFPIVIFNHGGISILLFCLSRGLKKK